MTAADTTEVGAVTEPAEQAAAEQAAVPRTRITNKTRGIKSFSCGAESIDIAPGESGTLTTEAWNELLKQGHIRGLITSGQLVCEQV